MQSDNELSDEEITRVFETINKYTIEPMPFQVDYETTEVGDLFLTRLSDSSGTAQTWRPDDAELE
jgi:hypothetical protein